MTAMNDIYLFLFTVIASTEGFVVAAILIGTFLIFQRKRMEAVLFGTSTILLMIFVQVLKDLFKIPRPPESLIEASGYAFPSGHATGSIFLALSIIFLTRNVSTPQRYIVWTTVLVLALLIGASRIHLGVHTLTQVLAGYALGIFCIVIFLVARKKLLREKA